MASEKELNQEVVFSNYVTLALGMAATGEHFER
jgi:hypothetical protein